MLDADRSEAPICIVGIGASAGGLEAIREMLAVAEPSSGLAYVVIQHLDPNHDSLLAELLDRNTALEVHQAKGGERVQPGQVYIIPPGHGLGIESARLRLTEFEKPRGLRRPIDDFFESLALDQGRRAACVILSGTGGDGSAGLRAIKEHGGLSIAQEPSTARYDGMPLSAQSTGLVDFTCVPDQIVDTIVQYHAHRSVMEASDTLARTVEQSIEEICAVLRKTIGHDFSGYKRSTLVRRIERRIQVLNIDSSGEYLQRLRTDPQECETLFREILINVTRFFRDGELFEALRKHAIAPLVRDAGDKDIRIWVPGCSSGEEVYTIAMLVAEEVRVQQRSIMIQIFATDIDDQMLGLARQGIYPLSALADIPEEMQERYTLARDGQFQFSSRLRDMIRFSLHSVVRDPPFSNVDLLSCRNLLIYFGEQLQAEALPIFHYALNPGGMLFLGPSESIGRYEHLFECIDQRARIFRRQEGAPEYPLRLPTGVASGTTGIRRPSTDSAATRVEFRGSHAAEHVLKHYAPATIQVSAAGDIRASTGQLGKYLDLAPTGNEGRSAQSLARPGVREAMSAAVRQSADGQRVIVRDLTVQSEYGEQTFDLLADPLPDGTILLVFRDRDRFRPTDDDDLVELQPSDSHVQSLEAELRTTRARLHTTVEELETANEELKSSNEEMMSMNEELQSTNEELATVNDELKSKVDELSVANADLMNFFASTALPLVVVDNRLRIRNFTEAILTIYSFRAGDRGRPLPEVTSILDDGAQVLDAVSEVVRSGKIRNMQVEESGGSRTWKLLITPYRMRDGTVNGATLVFTDISDALRLHSALESEGERLRLALEVTRLGVWEYDAIKGTMTFDETCADHLGFNGAGSVPLGQLPHSLSGGEVERLVRELEDVRRGEKIDVNFRVVTPTGSSRILHAVGRPVGMRRRGPVLGVMSDVTAEEEASRLRDLMLREMDHRVKNNLAIIMGILRGVGRKASTVRDVVDGVQGRVDALARSHDMTQSNPADRLISLDEAVHAALKPYEGQSGMAVAGPEVAIASKELTPLSLLLHEWATNAGKYGVLGPLEGRLEVRWDREQDGSVVLEWSEQYAQATDVTEEKPGFGSILARMSAIQLDGMVDTEISPQCRTNRLRFVPADKIEA